MLGLEIVMASIKSKKVLRFRYWGSNLERHGGAAAVRTGLAHREQVSVRTVEVCPDRTVSP